MFPLDPTGNIVVDAAIFNTADQLLDIGNSQVALLSVTPVTSGPWLIADLTLCAGGLGAWNDAQITDPSSPLIGGNSDRYLGIYIANNTADVVVVTAVVLRTKSISAEACCVVPLQSPIAVLPNAWVALTVRFTVPAQSMIATVVNASVA